MTTAARPTIDRACHWYSRTGEPVFEVPCKSRPGETRPADLRDARKLGLLPSVTTLLKLLHKPDLQSWIVEQACLAVLTSPRSDGEELDAFVRRVLQDEKHQDQERDAAADLGKRIHAALAHMLTGLVDESPGTKVLTWNEHETVAEYIRPVLAFLLDRKVIACEQVVVGRGYAGTVDLETARQEQVKALEGMTIRLCDNYVDLWDFKSCKRIPDKSYPEHRLQLAAYAEAIEQGASGTCVCDTYNVYISTTEPGQFKVIRNPNWVRDFADGFSPILQYWQWLVQWEAKA